jgi:hypothetical protein
MTKEGFAFPLPFRSFLYAILSVASELVALYVVLLRIDETPIEGNPEGFMLVMAALGITTIFIFFVLHRVFFGRLRELNVGLHAHWFRVWAAYLLIPLGIIAGNIGITGDGAVVLTDRSWFEVAWNGPAFLPLVPVLVDVLRAVSAQLLTTVAHWGTRRRKILFAATLFVTASAIATHQCLRTSTLPIFTPTHISPSYVEYVFDSGEDVDLGFTKRAYQKLKNERELPDEESVAIDDDSMTHVRLLTEGIEEGTIERRMWGDDLYELRQTRLDRLLDNYRMSLNGRLLFKEKMGFAAQDPVLDWRIVDGRPAFTFTVSCSPNGKNQITCDRDVWHDDGLMSKTYGVKDPRYLFSHDGRIGFVASHDGLDKIFFDGSLITPGFDTIWTHNCCSYTEILPTVFENGVLLFYAIRDGNNILVEVRLE